MHDAPAVRGREDAGDLGQQRNPGARAESLPFGVHVDRGAGHVFHREPRRTGSRHAAVDEAGHARMLELGEQRPFAFEAGERGGAAHVGPRCLDRDPLDVGAVGALGEPHVAHAAAAERAHQSPWAQAQAGGEHRWCRGEAERQGWFETLVVAFGHRQQ
jgi:hypothetical protein